MKELTDVIQKPIAIQVLSFHHCQASPFAERGELACTRLVGMCAQDGVQP